MKIRELCESVGIEYDNKNPKRSLNKLKQLYVLEQVGKRDYNIVRDLTEDEQIIGKKLTNCQKLLEDVICVQLSLSDDNTIRTDMKGFLELFNVVNKKYRYFSYRNITDDKLKLLEDFDDVKFENDLLCNYVDDVNPILYKMTKNVFKKLQSEMLIFVKEHLLFGKKYRVENEDGSVVEFTRVIEASNIHHEEYMRLFRLYAQEMGVSIDNMNNKIKKQIKNKVCKDMNVSYAYTEYELILNREGLKDLVNSSGELMKLKMSLNKNVVHKLNLSTQGNLKNYDDDVKVYCSDFLIKN